MFCTSLYITLLKCPVKISEPFYPPWQRGTGVSQGLSGHIMLNCSNRRFCVVLWQQKEELDQLQKHFPSPGLPFQSQIIKKIPYLGFSGAPQWRCLTQAVVASHSMSFCCSFNVCKVEWKRHRNSWLSFPGRAVQLHLAAQRETSSGDKGATSLAGT